MKKILVHNVVLQLEVTETDESYRDMVVEYISLINNIIGASELGCNPILLAEAIEPADIEIIK